ncbi:MAG: hypothetical protein JOY60_02730 [Burkholderiaceae bacterium]|nr:hypothetical protein [Roseateles sp.]MBV8468768.1 hypothetical protein [Burkholderiaceae bacterium]
MQKPPLPPTAAPRAANDVTQAPSPLQWAEIVQQLGAEIATPLSAALERIHDLIATGQIDRQSLRALRENVSLAREAGMIAQQLARLASGRLRLARERVQLAQVLRNVLAHRSRESQARGIQIRQLLKPMEVLGDGALIFSLLNALMDWALACTHSSIDLRLDLTPWPAKARLVCRFAHRSLEMIDDASPDDLPETLNSMRWRLVEQTAMTMGVLALREDESGITVLTLEFPHTLSEEPGMSGRDEHHGVDAAPTTGLNSRPLAGSHVLLVTPRHDLRLQVQDAVRHMGLIIDCVNSASEALQLCAEGLPHAIIFESAQRGPAFEHLFADVHQDVAGLCFVEVFDDAQPTQLSTATADGIARVARKNLSEALSTVLLFEMSKTH